MIFAVLALLPGAPAVVAAPAAPSAAEVSARLAELNRHFAEVDKATASRAQLLGRLDRYRRTIRDARREPAGPARDFKLRRLLAEARALAKQLSALDRTIARHQAALETARQALVRTLDALKGAQRAAVERSLARARPGSGARPRVLKVARPAIHPLDGPREIEEKADVLKDSEEKIRKRIQELEQVLASLERRRRLRSISSRVDRYTGLFNEDSSSRRVTRIRPTKVPADPGSFQGGGAPMGEYDSNGLGSADDGISRGVSSGTYAVVLRDVLTPSTVDALRKAGQSSDPEARIRALQKAREELRRAATDLQRRSQAYRERARQLRVRERK